MRQNFILLIGVMSLIILSGCDKVEGPYSITVPVNGGNDTVAIRKVLLEDYTGHTCQACPEAHKEAENLKSFFRDSLIIITIHAGFFAATSSPHYIYDFKTTEGTAFYQEFIPSLQPFPTGTVNRKKSGNIYIVDYLDWGNAVRNILNDAPDAAIKIFASWDPGTNIISGTFKTTFLNNINGDIALNVLYTEDSIINWQKFPSPIFEDSTYVHRHVLRGSLNGPWGNSIISDPVQGNEIFTDLYSMPIASDINPKQVSIVAILYNNSTKEIIQAEEVKLLP